MGGQGASVVIIGTGFHVTDAFDYLDIEGRNGVDLTSQWREKGLETYLGIGVSGFPNLFFLLGPTPVSATTAWC